MASSTPTTLIPLQEPVFYQFLHDVHHAYLLLHRRWLYSLQLLFPILNRHHYLALESGTNPRAFSQNIRTLRTLSPMPCIFLHLTLMKKRTSWMTCCSTTFLSPTNTLPPLHRMPSPTLPSSRPWHLRLPSENRRPKLRPKLLQNAVALGTSHPRVHLALRLLGQWKKNKNFVP